MNIVEAISCRHTTGDVNDASESHHQMGGGRKGPTKEKKLLLFEV